jgi:hypothetical protein
MGQEGPLLNFPVPSALTIALLVFGVLLFVGAGAALEISRRREATRKRLAREWDSIHIIFRTRGMPAENAAFIEDWVRQYARKYPLKAVSTREGFEELVDTIVHLDHRRGIAATVNEDLGVRLRTIRKELGLDHVPAGQSMMSTRELSDGQWMSIARADEHPPQFFRVMVEDVNEAYFYVSYKDGPASAAPKFPPGTRVRCSLWRGEDARYTFEACIAAFNAPPPAWTLTHTEKLARSQNRAHFRIRHDQEISAGVLNAPLPGTSPADLASRPVVTRLQGRISSLSAGGCAIVFQQSVARHVLLRVLVDVPGGTPIEVEVEIVSTAHISGGRHLVRGKFLGLSEDARDRIARYVHLKQQRPGAAPGKDSLT